MASGQPPRRETAEDDPEGQAVRVTVPARALSSPSHEKLRGKICPEFYVCPILSFRTSKAKQNKTQGFHVPEAFQHCHNRCSKERHSDRKRQKQQPRSWNQQTQIEKADVTPEASEGQNVMNPPEHLCSRFKAVCKAESNFTDHKRDQENRRQERERRVWGGTPSE